jgi:hypothetical protein
MCYFVLVGFSPEARSIARGLLKSTCHLRETTNPSVLGALPAGWHAGYLADEMCGCDMYADPATEDAPLARDERLATFRRKHSKPKYRKRGWSDAKIERAIHQMKEDAAHRPSTALRGIRIDVRRSIAELAQAAGSVRTLVHFFSGSVAEEWISAGLTSVSVDQFMTDDSLVEPDMWYAITCP